MAQVYDFKDYTVKLNEWFDMTKESISDEDIQKFINYYDLFKDYKILISDVRKDFYKKLKRKPLCCIVKERHEGRLYYVSANHKRLYQGENQRQT